MSLGPSKNPIKKSPLTPSDAIAPLWDTWAVEHRPEKRNRALAMFLALDEASQDSAIRMAGDFQRRQILRRQSLQLLAYLRQRAWEELDGAPAFDSDGDFVITPEHRAEWSAWLGRIRETNGDIGVQSSLRLKKIVRQHRFPPEPVSAEAAA